VHLQLYVFVQLQLNHTKMKTLLTAANLFLAIYFTIRFIQLLSVADAISTDINFHIFKLAIFPLIAIANFYHVINFLKSHEQ